MWCAVNQLVGCGGGGSGVNLGDVNLSVPLPKCQNELIIIDKRRGWVWRKKRDEREKWKCSGEKRREREERGSSDFSFYEHG